MWVLATCGQVATLTAASIMAYIQAPLNINMCVEKYVLNNGIGRVFNWFRSSNNVNKSRSAVTLMLVVLWCR